MQSNRRPVSKSRRRGYSTRLHRLREWFRHEKHGRPKAPLYYGEIRLSEDDEILAALRQDQIR